MAVLSKIALSHPEQVGFCFYFSLENGSAPSLELIKVVPRTFACLPPSIGPWSWYHDATGVVAFIAQQGKIRVPRPYYR